MSNNEKIANDLKDKAIKALEDANINVENKKTAVLNAEFSLGKFYALSEIIWKYDVETYVKLGEQTQERRDELTEITENIYKM